MKKLFYLLAVVSFLLYAGCGNAPKDKGSTDEEVTEVSADSKKSDDKIKDCDDFLDRYEKWMDDYLALMEDYMKNPMDAGLATKYTELASDAANWATEWTALYDCAGDKKYEKRFEEIVEKAEKKLEELGLD
jgi:hypothetical protein